ncbi:MAG TPA: bifunctional tetrahydrofolate synthase/dihydrofolate synthase [Gammaproteobacteria bacterium]|nr:bifunctional tetrahydrofolate synthase/dihydrofolate synthase [Gammaproteobacteria bacterium]
MPQDIGAAAVVPRTLADWLAWQESLHPKEIELGLARCRAVAARMGLLPVDYTTITVAGTNGKGSTVALLDAVYRRAGYRVATYTSPHLIHYNERIRVDGQCADDARICAAFARVEAAREGMPLTFFEFGTLAALAIFADAKPDLAVLEVGMGGRLDAVNIVDADVAVIATLDIDHVEFLGRTREAIAREKAGIMRAGRPAVCSDPAAPASLLECATRLGAKLSLLGAGFNFADKGDTWTWWSGDTVLEGLPRPALSGSYQLRNAAGVLKAVDLLQPRHPVAPATIAEALAHTTLRGRFQRLPGEVEIVLDVAHNAQAVDTFVATLRTLPNVPRTQVVLGMLKTKDRLSAMSALAEIADEWQLATVQAPKGASAEELHATWQQLPRRAPASRHASVAAAFAAARAAARPGDRIVAVGSFITVGDVLRILAPEDGDGD